MRCQSGVSIGDAVNNSLNSIVETFASFEGTINYYDFVINFVEEEKVEEKYLYTLGNCSGSTYSSQPLVLLSSSSEDSYYTSRLVICISG